MNPEIDLATPYSRVKLAIVALLTLNIALFALFDTLITTLDACVWVLLLISYELEAYTVSLPISRHSLLIIRRLLIAVIPIPFFGYLMTGEWLEATNALIWFLLIALIELRVSWPERVAKVARMYWLSNFAVFAGLIVMVGLWLWRGEWLDAYDAALWIVAFGIIEADLSQLFSVPTDSSNA